MIIKYRPIIRIVNVIDIYHFSKFMLSHDGEIREGENDTPIYIKVWTREF